jgi:5-methylcytosine-specific restriction endonuclease McrA
MATSRSAEAWRTDKRKTAERGYGGRWQRTRLQHLRMHPLCVMCEQQGVIRVATVVDHKVPHRGDMVLFWDPNNRQSLCVPHHSRDKQLIENGAPLPGGDALGQPTDPNHHWNATPAPAATGGGPRGTGG